jgi:cytochrome b subunit of formate dehydrogenase
MFSIISIVVFVGVVGAIALHHLVFPCGKGPRWRPIDIIRKKVHVFTLLFLEQDLSWLGVLKKLAYLLAMLCFVVLFLTGFVPVICGGRLSGYWLMIHVTFGGVFAVCLAFLAVMWAQRFCFGLSDLQWLRRLLGWGGKVRDDILQNSDVGRKSCFWVIVFLSLPLALTSILSMFPIFGTHGQEVLFELHRYSALVFAALVFIHLYLTIRAEIKD